MLQRGAEGRRVERTHRSDQRASQKRKPPCLEGCAALPTSVQAEAVSDGGFDAGVDAELGEDVGDVDAGGLGADEQRLGDLAVAAPGCDEGKYLGFTRAEARVPRPTS